MKSDELLQDELLHIISEMCNVNINDLTLETEILKDLGCVGDDAYDLIKTICLKYQINCKEFSPGDVCDSEGNNYIKSILNPKYFYNIIFHQERIKFPSFTINMLIKAAKSRRLKSIKPKGYYYAKKVVVD